VDWITVEDLLSIHQYVVQSTGGIPGILNPGALESAIARPFVSIDRVELFPSIEAKIAALIHSLIMFHPFADGNKRTALIAADDCLQMQGKRLDDSDGNIEFFWSIARGDQSFETILVWVNENVREYKK
jgi:death-on-curing protein